MRRPRLSSALWAMALLALLLAGCRPQPNPYISSARAIELAGQACHRCTAQEAPRNPTARLVSWEDVHDQVGGAASARAPDTKVWVVSFDGAWLLQGPPPAEGATPVPTRIEHLTVVLDARTGDVILVRS